MFKRARVHGSYDSIVRRRERGKNDRLTCSVCGKREFPYLMLKSSKGYLICADCWRKNFNEDGSKRQGKGGDIQRE